MTGNKYKELSIEIILVALSLAAIAANILSEIQSLYKLG